MPARVCLACGQITSSPSSRGLCGECGAAREQARPARAIYDNPRWRKLAAATVRAWVRRHGWRCPGWGREEHASLDLTADHRVPLAQLMLGGANLWDPANLAVLCRSCNGRKAAAPATAHVR